MKIRNLIYGTAVVCLFSTFLISEPSAQSLSTANVSVNECGDSPHWQGTQCIGYGRGPVPNYCCSSKENLTQSPSSYGGGFQDVVIDEPEEPTEVCGTKEVGGDITYCCHMISGSSPSININNAKDLLNNIQNTNRLDTVPSTSAIEALGNFTN